MSDSSDPPENAKHEELCEYDDFESALHSTSMCTLCVELAKQNLERGKPLSAVRKQIRDSLRWANEWTSISPAVKELLREVSRKLGHVMGFRWCVSADSACETAMELVLRVQLRINEEIGKVLRALQGAGVRGLDPDTETYLDLVDEVQVADREDFEQQVRGAGLRALKFVEHDDMVSLRSMLKAQCEEARDRREASSGHVREMGPKEPTQRIGPDVGEEAPDVPQRKTLPPSRQNAYCSYESARSQFSTAVADRVLYDWICEHPLPSPLEDYEPPKFETWQRYLQQALKLFERVRATPKAYREATGKSVVSAGDVEVPHQYPGARSRRVPRDPARLLDRLDEIASDIFADSEGLNSTKDWERASDILRELGQPEDVIDRLTAVRL